MKIDLSKIIKTATGKPIYDRAVDDRGMFIMNEKTRDYELEEFSMFAFIEQQLNTYQGGEVKDSYELSKALCEASEKGIEVIEISTPIFTFLRNKLVEQAKYVDIVKAQVLEHLDEEDAKHQKLEEKKKED